ncbi:MAG: hypothetical protein QME57_01800 [Patescibacteria group bacterium]|nr:hypothetical protein [Patescibacteria group bacterium]
MTSEKPIKFIISSPKSSSKQTADFDQSDFQTSRIGFVFDTCRAGRMDDVAANGRVISMATGENQSAYVYSTGEFGEGWFSHYFVNKRMLNGLADVYNHGQRTNSNVLGVGEDVVEEAFDYAKKITIPRQNPSNQ